MSLSNVFSILQTIIMLGLVIFLANISIKFLNSQMTKKNRAIKILEKVSINNNSALAIVDICGKYYLMSFTNNENKILKELEAKNLEEIILDMEKEDKFRNYFGVGKKVD